jgi:hypothetical protein
MCTCRPLPEKALTKKVGVERMLPVEKELGV